MEKAGVSLSRKNLYWAMLVCVANVSFTPSSNNYLCAPDTTMELQATGERTTLSRSDLNTKDFHQRHLHVHGTPGNTSIHDFKRD